MIDIGCLWFPDKGIVVYLVAAVVSVVTQRISPLRDDTKKTAARETKTKADRNVVSAQLSSILDERISLKISLGSS